MQKQLEATKQKLLKAFQQWCQKRGLDVCLQREEAPLDWCDPDAGTYPKSSLSIVFRGRCTLMEWEQRKPQQKPLHSWNSEHLACWFGKPSQVIKGHQNGCDIDLVTFTARPLWGLLGEHVCTE